MKSWENRVSKIHNGHVFVLIVYNNNLWWHSALNTFVTSVTHVPRDHRSHERRWYHICVTSTNFVHVIITYQTNVFLLGQIMRNCCTTANYAGQTITTETRPRNSALLMEKVYLLALLPWPRGFPWGGRWRCDSGLWPELPFSCMLWCWCPPAAIRGSVICDGVSASWFVMCCVRGTTELSPLAPLPV